MKFKTYKAAKNYLITRVEIAGVNVKDVNIDRLTTEVFIGTGVGDDFELELRTPQNMFPAILRALRIPRRDTVTDKQWTTAVRRMGTYMGICYDAEDADGLARELADQALFSNHMLKEAL